MHATILVLSLACVASQRTATTLPAGKTCTGKFCDMQDDASSWMGFGDCDKNSISTTHALGGKCPAGLTPDDTVFILDYSDQVSDAQYNGFKEGQIVDVPAGAVDQDYTCCQEANKELFLYCRTDVCGGTYDEPCAADAVDGARECTSPYETVVNADGSYKCCMNDPPAMTECNTNQCAHGNCEYSPATDVPSCGAVGQGPVWHDGGGVYWCCDSLGSGWGFSSEYCDQTSVAGLCTDPSGDCCTSVAADRGCSQDGHKPFPGTIGFDENSQICAAASGIEAPYLCCHGTNIWKDLKKAVNDFFQTLLIIIIVVVVVIIISIVLCCKFCCKKK